MRSNNNDLLNWVNTLDSATHHEMNTLRISLTYKYVANEIDLNWHDVLFAVKQGFLHHQDAIEHAKVELENDGYPPEVLELAIISSDEAVFAHSIHPYIDILADKVGDDNKINSKDKLMFVLLKGVYDGKAKLGSPHEDNPTYSDILNIAESIWHDFDFPESIAGFAAWLTNPLGRAALGSPEENRARLLEEWNQFLESGQRKWKSTQ